MSGGVVRSLWAEPRTPDPPARVWRDWLLIAALAGGAVVENLLRPDMTWRPAGVGLVLVLAVALLGRRTHPLGMVALGFGPGIALDTAAAVGGVEGPISPYSMAFLLVLPYALFRWASGRDVVLGSAVMLAAFAMSVARDNTALVDSLIGLVLLSLPAVLGLSVRFWSVSRRRELDQVRLRERAQLARELHDTVAHHVSAMVIRAQAGRVMTESQPGAAVDALKIIEAEGSRTLAEMRRMVGALREPASVDLAPVGGLADVSRLARTSAGEPRVDVQMSGDLEDLSPSVSAALYRIAQESITNAVRHARHVTRVVVVVLGTDDHVRLTVRDDGEPVSAAQPLDGYGIVGMSERAALLGGTLEVGPGGDRGWEVDVVLPRARSTQ